VNPLSTATLTRGFRPAILARAHKRGHVREQDLRAALPAVLWLLGCSALRAKDALRPPASGPALAGSGRHFGQILAAECAFTVLSN